MSGKLTVKQHIIEGGAQAVKVTLGGAGTAGASYVASEQTLHAVADSLTMSEVQAYATLIAAICTGLYFFSAFVLTCIKAVKEVKGNNTGD